MLSGALNCHRMADAVYLRDIHPARKQSHSDSQRSRAALADVTFLLVLKSCDVSNQICRAPSSRHDCRLRYPPSHRKRWVALSEGSCHFWQLFRVTRECEAYLEICLPRHESVDPSPPSGAAESVASHSSGATPRRRAWALVSRHRRGTDTARRERPIFSPASGDWGCPAWSASGCIWPRGSECWWWQSPGALTR
jgi:hypothetical protein